MELRLEIPQREINALLKRANRYSAAKERQVMNLIRRYTRMVEGDAKKLAPVNKKIGLGGQLRAQIRSRFEKLAGFVVAGANYSIFQELGTGRRGAASNVRVRVSGYQYGTVAGVSAQPFLMPAFEKHIGNFVEDLKKLLLNPGVA